MADWFCTLWLVNFGSVSSGMDLKLSQNIKQIHSFPRIMNKAIENMGSKQYGVDHLNMEINKFTVERKVNHRLNQSQFRISILVFFRVNFTGY